MGLSATTSGARETASPATVTTAGLAPAGYAAPPIRWGPCTDPTLVAYGSECGTLVVPRDLRPPPGRGQDRPRGLALAQAQDPGRRLPGRDAGQPRWPRWLRPDLLRVPGFPPQRLRRVPTTGSGSTRAGSGRASLSLYVRLRPFSSGSSARHTCPTTLKILQATGSRRSVGLRQGLREAPGIGACPSHVKTTRLGRRHGEPAQGARARRKINFYGFSYGTYLGPGLRDPAPDARAPLHLRRHHRPTAGLLQEQPGPGPGLPEDLRGSTSGWLAKYHEVYHVGDTFQQVRKTLPGATIAKLDKPPSEGLPGASRAHRRVHRGPGYYVYGWEDVAEAYSAYINDGDPTGLIAQFLTRRPTPGADNDYAMYLGTQCTDAPWPCDPAQARSRQLEAGPELRRHDLVQRLVQRPVRLLEVQGGPAGEREGARRCTCRS